MLPSGLRVPPALRQPPFLPFDIVLLFLQDMADMGQLRPVQFTDAVLPGLTGHQQMQLLLRQPQLL